MNSGPAADSSGAGSTRPAPPALPPPAVPLWKPNVYQSRPTDAEVQEARKQPLQPNVAMARYRKHVALLEAYPGQFVLRTSPSTAVAYPASSAERRRLIAGRIVLTAADGTQHKVCVWQPGARAPIELGQRDRISLGGSGIDLGDDPISTVIGLLLLVWFALSLPVRFVLWLRRRHRRTVVAKRLLAVGQGEAGQPR